MRMNRIAGALLLFALAGGGCASNYTPAAPPPSKEVLRNVLDSGFDLSTIPLEKEADFYAALAAFATGRKPGEFVQNVVFDAPEETIVYFSTPTSHAGGTFTVKKKDGQWVTNHKTYYN